MTARDDIMICAALEDQLLTTLGINRWVVTLRAEAWSTSVGDPAATVTPTDVVLPDNPTLETASATGGTASWFGGGLFPDDAGQLVLAEYRLRRIMKPWTDPDGHPQGFDPATLVPPGTVTTRQLALLAGEGFLALAAYAGGEPFLVIGYDATDPFVTDLYLRRAAVLTHA